jgi:hypothetical protein
VFWIIKSPSNNSFICETPRAFKYSGIIMNGGEKILPQQNIMLNQIVNGCSYLNREFQITTDANGYFEYYGDERGIVSLKVLHEDCINLFDGSDIAWSAFEETVIFYLDC